MTKTKARPVPRPLGTGNEWAGGESSRHHAVLGPLGAEYRQAGTVPASEPSWAEDAHNLLDRLGVEKVEMLGRAEMPIPAVYRRLAIYGKPISVLGGNIHPPRTIVWECKR